MSSDSANLADFLTPDQQASLTMFQEITQISDNDLSLSILTEFNFNVDNAVNNFLNQGATNPHADNTNSQSSMSSGTSSGSGNGTWTTNSGDNGASTDSVGTHATNAVAPQQNIGILGLLSRPLSWLINTRGTVLNPDADTRKFNDEFDRKFLSTHPKFFNRSYTQAVEHAFRNQKFLLVYLHSPLHEDTNKFCQQVMCKPQLSRFCDENYVVWAGQIWDFEAYHLSLTLRVSTYPFMALLMCNSSREVSIADRIQGQIGEEVLITRLRNVMRAHQPTLNNQRRVQEQHTQRRSFIQEQDAAFRESEEIDRRNMELKAKERREAEEREKMETQIEQQRVEDEARAEMERKADVDRKAAALAEEPAAGADIATIRVHLPSGSKVTRRFHKDVSIQILYDWLTVYFENNGMSTRNFSLNTTHPKRELTVSPKSVEAEGLFPRAMLVCIDHDL